MVSGLLAAGLVLALGVAGWLTAHNLVPLTRWALQRTFPGVRVQIGRMEIALPGRLSMDHLTLKSRSGGEVLFSLARGSISFDLADLWARQIGEIRLDQPVLHASPRLAEIFRSRSPSSNPSAGVPWTVRRLVCDYGELSAMGYGNPGLKVSTKFSFDLRNLSPGAPDVAHEVTLWDLQVSTPQGAVLSLDLARIGFDFSSLASRSLDAVTLTGGSLQVGDALRELFAPSPGGTPPSPAAETWTLAALHLENLKVRVDDRRSGLSEIGFAVHLSLKNIPLAQAVTTLGEEEQNLEITDLAIHSPLDPFTRVITLDRLAMRFTLAGLLRKEIRELTLTGPAVYVGEDLFWYMETAQKNLPSDASDAPSSEPGWTLRTLRVDSGRLILGSGGRRQYGLPLNFRTTADNISLDNLAALKLQAVLEIPPQKYAFASYQLEFTTQQGELRFSYPPEKNSDNLVGTVRIQDIRWRQYRAKDSWVSVTFDRQGINGTFGGATYRGEAWGGFSFTFDSGAPWAGWISGKRLDLKSLTDVIAPQNLRLTGPLEFALAVHARGSAIDSVKGNFHMKKPGRFIISKMDDFLANIPDTWNQLKQSGTRVVLESLRDFDYTRGEGKFDFVNSAGTLQLHLQGPSGSRNFQAVLHANKPSPPSDARP